MLYLYQRQNVKMKTTQEYIDLLRQYKEDHAQAYGIKEMGIFGSVARGEQKESSDIDIYIEGEAQSLLTMSHIKIELESLLERKVDIVRLRNNMNLSLRKRILEEGIYA